MRILRFKDLKSKGVAGSRATLWRLQESDSTFPKAVAIGGGVGWHEGEIDAWIEARPRIGRRAQRSLIVENNRKVGVEDQIEEIQNRAASRNVEAS